MHVFFQPNAPRENRVLYVSVFVCRRSIFERDEWWPIIKTYRPEYGRLTCFEFRFFLCCSRSANHVLLGFSLLVFKFFRVSDAPKSVHKVNTHPTAVGTTICSKVCYNFCFYFFFHHSNSKIKNRKRRKRRNKTIHDRQKVQARLGKLMIIFNSSLLSTPMFF